MTPTPSPNQTQPVLDTGGDRRELGLKPRCRASLAHLRLRLSVCLRVHVSGGTLIAPHSPPQACPWAPACWVWAFRAVKPHPSTPTPSRTSECGAVGLGGSKWETN